MAERVKPNRKSSIKILGLKLPVLDLGLSHMTVAETIKVSVLEFDGIVMVSLINGLSYTGTGIKTRKLTSTTKE